MEVTIQEKTNEIILSKCSASRPVESPGIPDPQHHWPGICSQNDRRCLRRFPRLSRQSQSEPRPWRAWRRCRPCLGLLGWQGLLRSDLRSRLHHRSCWSLTLSPPSRWCAGGSQCLHRDSQLEKTESQPKVKKTKLESCELKCFLNVFYWKPQQFSETNP